MRKLNNNDKLMLALMTIGAAILIYVLVATFSEAQACGQIVYDEYGVPHVTSCGGYSYNPPDSVDYRDVMEDHGLAVDPVAEQMRRQEGNRMMRQSYCDLIGGNEMAREACFREIGR